MKIVSNNKQVSCLEKVGGHCLKGTDVLIGTVIGVIVLFFHPLNFKF